MSDINQVRPDLVQKGWTQEMWDARDSMSPLSKAFSTDDGFAQDWAKGTTDWQKFMSQHPGMDPRSPGGIRGTELKPYVPGADRNSMTGALGKSGAEIDANSPGAKLDTAAADAERAQLQQLLGSLQQQAASGGGEWENTFRDATAKASGNAQALGQSQTGGTYGSQLRNIGNAQGAVAQRAVGDEETLRSQSKIDAQDNLSQLLGGMGSQDVSQAANIARVNSGVTKANQALKDQAKQNNGALMQAAGSAVSAYAGMSDGGPVPGSPQVFGDSEVNDTVPAKLSPGEIVIPRSISQGPDAPERAAEFVRAIMSGGQNYADGGEIPTGVQAPTIQNGGLLDDKQFMQNREASNALKLQLAARAAGQGPSVAPQMAQRSSDNDLATALRASQSGKAPAGDLVQAVAGGGGESAVNAAKQTAIEQSLGAQRSGQFGMDRRGIESQMAMAQQDAAWQRTLANAGLTLQAQAAVRNALAAQGQAAMATASMSSGNKTQGYQGAFGSDYYGERGGPADLSNSEPDFGEWDNPYESKAHGGVIGDDDEKRRARDFVNSLRGA